LWKSAERAPEAADKLAITATRLKAMGLIDKIVPEPLGGAHRDPEAQMQSLRRVLVEARREIGKISDENRLEVRFQRLMAYGKFKDVPKR
jgi:acetyl-CoA carboxylase carboxyl transferase subunit alpha